MAVALVEYALEAIKFAANCQSNIIPNRLRFHHLNESLGAKALRVKALRLRTCRELSLREQAIRVVQQMPVVV